LLFLLALADVFAAVDVVAIVAIVVFAVDKSHRLFGHIIIATISD
jgi:uncharacterized membrane protein YqjE